TETINTFATKAARSRHGRDKSRMSAFGGKADKRRVVALTASVADDPKRTDAGLKSRIAAGSSSAFSLACRHSAASLAATAPDWSQRFRVIDGGHARRVISCRAPLSRNGAPCA